MLVGAGTGAEARFSLGYVDLAVDGGGNLFVADTSNTVIRRVEVATGLTTTCVDTPGRRGVQPGPLPGGLNTPQGLAVLPGGQPAITDYAECVVLLVRP